VLAAHALERAWSRAEDRIFEAAEALARREGDVSIAEAVGNVGPWTKAALFLHGAYDCGAAPEAVSTRDFARVEDDRDMLVAGGLGALVRRLAAGLDIRTGVEATAIACAGEGCAVEARDGRRWQARRVILTVSPMVLAAGRLALPPEADALGAAARRFHAASYEHAVLRAAHAPWSHRADQIVLSMAGEETIVLFAHMDGSDLHYFDLVAEQGQRLADVDEAARVARVKAMLTRHFGEVSGVELLAVTGWNADPFARGAWALAGIGGREARAALRGAFGALHYAGEASSDTQWGTVGGAWLEGARAAGDVLGALAASA
jgi:hypothetical protein